MYHSVILNKIGTELNMDHDYVNINKSHDNINVNIFILHVDITTKLICLLTKLILHLEGSNMPS